MRVQEVMTEKVRTVPTGTPVEQAWTLMKTDGIHHLVVTDGRRIVGVLSNRDGGRRPAGARREATTVEELMTKHVVTITPDATIRHAANVMRGRTIGCLPVTRGNRLVGIVTTSDLLDAVGGGVDRPSRGSRPALNYKTPHRRKHPATGVW